MTGKRASHYKQHKRVRPPEKLEELNEIAKKHNLDAQIEQVRLELADEYISRGVTPMEATDDNAFAFMLQQAKVYIAHFGMKPLKLAQEIEDMIGLLERVQAEALSEEAQRHNMINELIEHGAHWADEDAPSNVGAFVYPDWMDTTNSIRKKRRLALQGANNTWNKRKGTQRRSRKRKKLQG